MFIDLRDLDSSGELCLDFANTVVYRREARRADAWTDPDSLGDWLAERLPLGELKLDQASLAAAVRLREAIYEILSAHAAGRSAPTEATAVLGDWIRAALAELQLNRTEAGFAWGIHGLGLEAGLGIAALSAATLLTGESADRLRECANEGCGWLFLDRSRNRSRRWCAMSDCGNVAKARRHYQRVRQQRTKPASA